MTRLGDLFDEADAGAARAAGSAQLGGEKLGAVHGRVRRAHARRSAFRASLAAVAVVVLGAAAAYGLTRGPSDMADGAAGGSDKPSPAATPSSTPSPSSSALFFDGTVLVDEHLPTAQAITPEVWASVEPGWSLVSYRESWVRDEADERGPGVIYLVSPEGERYQLTLMGDDTVSVVAWEAGSMAAAVSVQPAGDPPYAAVMDLVTGEITPVDGYAPYMWSIAHLDSEGHPVWNGNDATFAWVSIAPDGSASEYQDPQLEGSAGEVAYNSLDFAGRECGEEAPFDDQSSIVACWDNRYSMAPDEVDPAEAHRAYLRVWPAEDRVEVLFDSTFDKPGAQQPTRAGDYVVAATGAIGWDCPSSYSILDGGEPTPVPGWSAEIHPNPTLFLPFGATANVLTWGVTSGCSGDVSPIVVVISDLEGGTGVVAVPYPEGRPSDELPVDSVTGVAVGR